MNWKRFILVIVIAKVLALVILTTTAYAQHTPTNDDLMYQNFDENTGTIAVDDAFGINNMSLTGSATWASGYIGTGLDTGATGATNASTLLDTFPENGTIDFWFTPTATIPASHGYYGILSKQNSAGSQEMELLVATDEQRLRWIIIAGTTVSVYSYNRTWTSGTWYHIGLVWNVDGGKQLYVNSVLEGNSSTHKTVPTTGTDADFTVGRATGSGVNFDMTMDELVVANTSGIVETSITTAVNIYVKDEDTLAPLENVSLTIYNSTGQLLYNNSDIDGNITITPNWFGTFTGIAYYQDGARTQTIYSEYSTVQNTTFYFPNPDYSYVYTFTTTSGGLPLNESTISMYRYINASSILVTRQDTQIDGTAVFYMRHSVPYSIVITHANCTTQSFSYIFSPVSYSIPVSMACLGGNGTINPNFYIYPLTINWLPNSTQTRTGINITAVDNDQQAGAVWLNVTRFNYTGTHLEWFENVSDYQAVFNYTNLLVNNNYHFEVCFEKNNYTTCFSKNYINSTFTGIGNWTAEDWSNAGGLSVTTMSIIFMIILGVIVSGLYYIAGMLGAFPAFMFGIMIGVSMGIVGLGVGILLCLVCLGLLIMVK